MPIIRDPSGRKTPTPRPHREGGFRDVKIPKPKPIPTFKPPTPTQELGVAPVTTHAPNQAPYKPGRAPAQVVTTRINRTRAASPVPQNPVDPRVVQIQQHLRALGYPVAVDGVMGPLTRTAMQMSNNGTTPNFVHHPDHARAQARDYNRRVRSELRKSTPRGRAGIVKSQFVEPQPGEDPIIPPKPQRFLPGEKRDKPIFYHPMFEGQKPAGTTGAFRGPDGTLYFPGERAPKGSRITTVPYYQARSAGEQPLQSILGSTDHQDALRRFKFENEGGIGGAILAGALHPAVDLLQAAAGERGITPGGAISDVAQIASVGIPVAGPTARALGTLGDVMQAVRAEGLTTNTLRSIRDLRTFSNQAALEAMRGGRVRAADRAVTKLPIVSPQRDELIQAFKDAPRVTPQQVRSATKFVDQIARNLAATEDITPEEAYSHMISAAKYHGADPTASEAQAISKSTTFQRGDLTNFPASQDSWGDVWAKPEQLKAEMSAKRLGVPFVSKLHTLVADMPDKVGIQEILGKLKSAGIKQDEVKWNRFDEFLASVTQKGQKSVTRAEALAWLDKHYLKIEENRRFGPRDPSYGYGEASINANDPKFGTYTLPGGQESNYQEFTIRLPADQYGNLYSYTSHFPDPNIIAHARTTDRSIDGDHSLMIEEIQSDWHQAGQKQGYKMPVTEHPDYPMRAQAVEEAAHNVASVTDETRRRLADAIIQNPQFANVPDNLRDAFVRNVETRFGVNLTDISSLRSFQDKFYTVQHARDVGARAEVRQTDRYGYTNTPLKDSWQAHVRLSNGDKTLGTFDEGFYPEGQAWARATNEANSFNLLVDMPDEAFNSVRHAATGMLRSLEQARNARDLLRALESDAQRGVHEAPFAKTWHELAFKRMLAEAVDKGYDRVGWTTGRTQAQRYDLGNFFRRLEIRAEGHAQGYSNSALEEWANEMATQTVHGNFSAEEYGWDSYEEERLRRQAESNLGDGPQEEDYIDPDTGELDQDAYDEAMDERRDEVEAEFEDLKSAWEENAVQNAIEHETEYYMDNASEYGGPSSDDLTVYATDHEGREHTQEASSDPSAENSLADVVGPDVAAAYHENGTTVFEGDNLVMGEHAKSALGASHFYDKKLTGFVNKYLKKFGVSVEKKKIGSGKQLFDYRLDFVGGRESGRWSLELPGGQRLEFNDYWDAINAQHDRLGNIPRATLTHEAPGQPGTNYSSVWVKWDDFPEGAQQTTLNGAPAYEGWGREYWGPFDNEEQARQETEDLLIRKMREWGQGQGAAGEEVHSIPITDEVRKFVDEGQPLFQKGRERRVKGAVDLGGREGSVIHLFARGDITTIVHEMGHVLHQYMPELRTLDQEKFARSFERYFAEGVAPTRRQQRLFDKMSAAMLRVYRNVENIPDANLTPDVRMRFDDFFTRETQRNPRITTMAGSQTLKQLDDFHTQEAGYYRPGNSQRFYDNFSKKPLEDLEAELTELKSGPKVGHRWPQSNYYRALERAIRDKTSQTADPALTAAAMQVKDGGMEPAQAAAMFKLDEADVRAELGRLPDYEQKAYNNADVGAGPATTQEDARTILDHAQGTKLEPFPIEGLPNATRLEHTRPDGTKSYLTFPNREEGQRYLDNLPSSREPGDHWLFQDEIPPDENLATPYEALSTEEKARRGLRNARATRKAQDLGYSEERRARFARAEEIMQDDRLDPIERHRLAKLELRGELPKIEFEGFKELDSAAVQAMVRRLQSHPSLSSGQRIRAVDALLEGVDGKTPQPKQILLLEHVFGKMTTRGIMEIAKHPYREMLLDALNIPRSFMATLDFSAPFRQGLVAGARHPGLFAKNFGPMLRAAFSETYYASIEAAIHNDPLYPTALDGGLALTDFESQLTREEQYFSRMAERLTGGRYSPVRASGRAYVTFLNKMRFDMFRYHMRAAGSRGVDVHDEEFLGHLSEFINSATGRGGGGEKFERSAAALNTLLFSPRLLKSRLNFLNPLWYAKQDKYTRMQSIRSAVTLGAEVGSFVTAMSMVPGVRAVVDPRNPDWGKVKIGNTRIDVAGGFQQPIRLFAQVATGTAISSTTGKKQSLTSGGFGDPTKLDLIIRFFEGKESPIASFVTDYLRNSDQVGNKFEIKREVAQRLTPLLAQDSRDLYKQRKGGMDGIALAAGAYSVGAFGFGMQTYGPKDPAKKPQTKLQDEAKQAGVGAVPKEILIAVDHKAHLDGISASNKGKPLDALKEAVAYYKETTGQDDFSAPYRLVKRLNDEKGAHTLLTAIRAALVGPALSTYEKAVKQAVEAQGVK